MNLWMVRAGKHGEAEAICLEKGIVTIGWNDLPDLKQFKTREQLQTEYKKHYTEKNVYSEGNKVGQIWRFANEIKKGDFVVLPSKSQPEIHVGIIKGSYQYKKISSEVLHTIPVEWRTSVARVVWDEDLLYSFGSLLTVSRISRNDAPSRVLDLLTSIDEGREGYLERYKSNKILDSTEDEGDFIQFAQTEELAYTKIETHIRDNFKEYLFEDLIREILKAHGYNTARTKEIGNIVNKKKKGADGGVDILASKGPLGFDQPSICIQVKSGEGKLPPKELRELVGVMATFKADHGLLVSWGGFSDELIREAREKYFTIRLWNSDDIIHQLFEHYEKLSDDFKNKLPLKRIWVLEEKEEL